MERVTESAQPLFQRDGAGFQSAPIVRGPWDERMMHGGAPSALLARTIEAAEPGADLVVTRLTIDFLSGVPLGRVDVAASVVRPGRRFQVVEATLDAGGGTRASRGPCGCAGRTSRRPSPRRSTPRPRSRRPSGASRCRCSSSLRGPHPDATEIRQVAGELGSGAVAAWIRLRGEVVAGEAPSQLARVAAAADFANGLSWILPWRDWLLVNTELTIHLAREPAGDRIAVDARTSSSAAGFGLSTATLHDLEGPFGVCAQSLFVEPR